MFFHSTGEKRSVFGIFIAGSVIVAAVFMLISCDGGSSGGSPPSTARSWYYEDEFLANPTLMAKPDQVVILRVLSGEGESEHKIPYQDEEGGETLFAVESDDPFVTWIEIFDSADRLVGTTARGDGGVYLNLETGGYVVKAYHQGLGSVSEETVAFIRRQAQGQAVALSAESAADTGTLPIEPESPAYVALQFVSGDYEDQYLAAVDGSVWEDGHSVDVRFMKAIPLDTSGDEFQSKSHLFSFKKEEDGDCDYGNYPEFTGNYSFDSWTAASASQNFIYMLFSCGGVWDPHCPASQTKFPVSGWTSIPGFHPHTEDLPRVSVQDKGDGTFIPWAYSFYAQPCSPLYAADNGYVYYTEFSESADPDSFRIDPTFMFYKDGTQIDRRNLEKGQVVLYEGEDYTGVAVVLNASLSDASLVALDQIKSVAFGLYTDTTAQFFSQKGYSGNQRTIGVDVPNNLDLTPGDMHSIRIFDSRKILVASKQCPHCNLAKVDLSDINLDGADLSHANLMDASLHHASLKQADLSAALLSGANLTNANFSGASFHSAFLNGNADLNLGAATLTGAYLKNANLAGANLGGADFSSASFHSGAYNAQGCAQDSNNPPFSKSCASAQGANMNAAAFVKAYLAGTDFSSVTATAADFQNAVLTGAHFVGAHLETDIQTSSRTNFTGAFIGGANFKDALVDNAKFENAYINFSQNGDIMLFTIPATHTQFPGFTYDYGDSPCVWFVFTEPTVVPTTYENNICPDGAGGPCDNSWTDPLVHRDQSPWPNSSYHDSSPLCDTDHIKMDW